MSAARQGESAIVAGSGIIGIACAHYLSNAGWNVTVIDRGTIGGGCSHANCGFICPSHLLPLTEPGAIREGLASLLRPHAPFRIKPRVDPSLWYWLWQFARRCRHRQMLEAGRALKAILDSSMQEYQRLIGEASLECEWQQTGLLYVLQTERGLREFAATDRLLAEQFDMPARRIDSGELAEFEPALKPGLAGGYYYEQDASLRPDRLNASWAQRLREQGVTFIEQCALQRIEKTGGRVTRLQTSRGALSADVLIVATGAWSSQLADELECPIPIQPGKGYSVTMSRPQRCPRYPLLFPEHRVAVSPFENGYRLGSMMEFAGFDPSIPEQRIRQLRESARPYLIEPCTDHEHQRWYGWRPMTWDSLPVIGPVPRLANAWLATGHNMLGVTLAPATGRLIAEMVHGQPPHIDPAPYSPNRF